MNHVHRAEVRASRGVFAYRVQSRATSVGADVDEPRVERASVGTMLIVDADAVAL